MTAVTASASSGSPFGRSSGGPNTDTNVTRLAIRERSTVRARRRTSVRITTSDSLRSSISPVRCRVRANSTSRLADNSTNSSATIARAVMSVSVSRLTCMLVGLLHPVGRSTAGGFGLRRVVDEVGLAGGVEQLLGDRRLLAAVAAQRDHLVDQVARLAGAQRPADRRVVLPDQVFDHHLVEAELPAGAGSLQEMPEEDEGRGFFPQLFWGAAGGSALGGR